MWTAVILHEAQGLFQTQSKGNIRGSWCQRKDTPNMSSGVGLVHALHDWERYKDPVEYRNMSHSHCFVLLEVGVSALTQSSVYKSKVAAL